MNVSSVKNLNGETFSAVQDASFVAYSADQWEMSAGEGVSFVNDIPNKITRIDVTGGWTATGYAP